MSSEITVLPATDSVFAEADKLFRSDYNRQLIQTDRWFAGLMVFQWIAAIVAAIVISPRTWSGSVSMTNPHVWAAVFMGGAITLFPVLMASLRGGFAMTRHVIGIAQMLMGALLIHLTGGRIETHFHVFGSLAFLAFYRDWRVLVSASAVVAADHLLRGMYWPQSVFGVVVAGQWRWLEHAAWVIFEDIFLIMSCLKGVREMKAVAFRHAQLEATNEVIEQKVRERTEELASHRQMLESTVHERTRELQGALENLQHTNARLHEANMHRSRFLSTMSHELRTPLNGILGFTDLLASQGFGPLNEKQKDYVGRIDTSGAHLLSLINDVLDVAKIDIGAMELNSTHFDAESVIRSTVQMISSQLNRKAIQVSFDIEEHLGAFHADERKYRQILINLLSNAIKYSPAEQRIVIRVWQGEDEMGYTSVTDFGVGISDDEQKKVFDEFHQTDRQRDEALGGIGLGLSLTKRLVELHNGTIGVESEIGKGSTFWFSVPATAAPKPHRIAVEPQGNSEETRVQRKKILVAEDNEMNLDMITNMLSLRDHEVYFARNGKECIDLAIAYNPDLILTDIRMPVMDGLESTRHLRSLPQFKNTPIIALTANASEVSAQVCIDAGCNEHISKPVKSTRLFSILDKYLIQEPECATQ